MKNPVPLPARALRSEIVNFRIALLGENFQKVPKAFIDAKARVGYAMNNMLAYGFAGYTSSEFEFYGGPVYSGGGLNYGVGVDMMVGTNMFVGVEYIVRDLAIGMGGDQVQNTNINALQVRAGWKF